MKYLFSFLFLATSFVSFSQNRDESAIRKILNEQTQEWNKGNLEKFMSGYWQNDSLVFIGKKGPVYGFNNALNNYKKGYPDTSTMGKLHFEIVSVTKLSNEYYFVIGKWFLNRSVGNVGGAYTLLFRKIKGEWKIIVDHSS